MTIERREEYAEVMSPIAGDLRLADVSPGNPVPATTHQAEVASSGGRLQRMSSSGHN